ncbi:MAG: carbon monoxide dehydrogenase subunit G [Anaerolineales bacterium]|nr:MAG: carbon monoxide dehydrogenase subunit G [Anaerolineales bacterium]
MNFEGNVTINAPVQKVWEFLTNPDTVSQCAPGLKSVEIVVPDQQFKAVAAIGFGAVSVTFTNDVSFVELNPPERAVVQVHGIAPGSAVDVMSEMKLSEAGNGITELHWKADINVVGTIASLASRMMGGVTKKLTGMFFTCVKGKIES